MRHLVLSSAIVVGLAACANSKPAFYPPTVAVAPATSGLTEPQARMVLMDSGYSNISSLKKNDAGHWHGAAVKGGQTVKVAVDTQGKIVS